MRKTDIKITIFTLFALFGGAFSALASEITPRNVIDLINQERTKIGLADLAENVDLTKAAELKARDMLEKDYFAHTSPEGLTPWHWIEKAGYDYKFAGENLAINFKSAEKQNEALMKSATHRKNILGERFNEVGVAVMSGTVNGKEVIITVQQFGNRGVAVALPEKKSGSAQEKEAAPGAERAVLIDSGLAAGRNDLIGKAGSGVVTFFGKVGNIFLGNNFPINGLVAILSFAAITAVILEILRRFHVIDLVGRKKSGALHTISMEEYENLFRKLPAKIERMQIIYLHQMKQRE